MLTLHRLATPTEAVHDRMNVAHRIGPNAIVQLAHALHEAGERTADYLMAHRIPRVAQLAMRIAPRSLALNMLLRAMTTHAWTFVGSGRFSASPHNRGATFRFEHCAMCRGLHAHEPVCAFYAGTFERLMRQLVHHRARVQETTCCAQGDTECRFEVTA